MYPIASTGNPADFACRPTTDNKLILEHYTGPGGAVSIPETIDGRPVTRVHGNAFTDRRQMTSLNIPASIIELGDARVRCMEGMVEGAQLGGAINVFQHCSGLTAITVDAANPKYGSVDGVLFDKSLTTLIHYPNASPGSYRIPAGVSRIDHSAFHGSVGLTEIMVDPANSVCSGRDGMLYNKDQTVLLQCPCGKTGTVAIPDGVIRIAENAFYGCKNLTAVEIPDSVTSIGESAFLECTNLARVNIPERIAKIEPSAFSSCTNLIDVALPDGMTTVGRFAFSGCKSLGRVNIPATVVSIETFAFHGCAKLTNLSIPASVTRIGEVAFGECDGLAEIQVDEANPSFSSVNGVLFNRAQTAMILCPAALSGVCQIPATVTKIERDVFATCAKLTDFKVAEGNPEFSDVNGVLFNHDRTTLLKYPRPKSGAYQIPESVATIGTHAFCGCVDLTGVKIPASVTHIGYGAFSHCAGLTEVEIPASVKIIEQFAFDNCKGLTSLTIPASVSNVSHCAFSYCTGLTRVNLPASIIEIGSSAFRGCTDLARIRIPGKVATIGDCAFEGCASLTRIDIPASITKIEMYAFGNCPSLTSAVFSGKAPVMDWSAFKGSSPEFKAYYLTGSSGFTSPIWQGCAAEGLAKLPEDKEPSL